MKKLAVTALLGLLGTLLVGLAPAAQAYPEVQFSASVNKQVVYGLASVTGTAVANVHCDWQIEWNGSTASAIGVKKFTTAFKAPDVKKVTVIPMRFTCAYDANETVTGTRSAVNASWTRTINVTVLPRATNAVATTGGGTDMPNTGGPSLLFLVGGLALLLAGVAAVAIARRRNEGFDLDPSRA